MPFYSTPLTWDPWSKVILELEPDAAGRKIDWYIGDLPSVYGDAAMLRIAITNLIANALKFTRSLQEAQIEIGSRPSRKAEAVIFVRDNSVGFDRAYSDKLKTIKAAMARALETCVKNSH